MRAARVIHCVDAHAEGEATRVVVGGVLDVPGATMLDKALWLEREGDWLRRLCLFEPRGSAPLSATVVLPSAQADAGFVIMESSSYEGMSGTNALNTAAVLLETGMVEMVEPTTSLVLEAPAGLVRVVADCSGGRVERLTFENVPAFCTALDAAVEVPGVGTVPVDLAYGGAFCAFVDAAALGFSIVPDEARDLGELGERIRPHVTEQLAIEHPLSEPLGYLSFVVFVAPPRAGGDARHATIVSPGRLDRAPTGTATSARIAVLDARGSMGETYVAESVLDTRFTGRVVGRTKVGPVRRGRAGDHRPGVDHGLPPARRRPDRPAGRRLQAAGHLGSRRARGHAQPLNVSTTTDAVTRAAPLGCPVVVRARPHRDELFDGGLVEVHRELHELAGLRRSERAVQLLALAGMDREQVELAQVALGRRDDDQSPSRRHHAPDLGRVAGREDVDEQVRRAVLERQRGPDVTRHGGDPRMGRDRPLERRTRGVEREPARLRPRVEQLGQVVPGPGADVDDRPGLAGGGASAAAIGA